LSKHARQEITDWTHATYEAHLACSMAFERFAVRLGELGFTESCHLAQEEAKRYHLAAEQLKEPAATQELRELSG
jgi:hypothetical protein